uniref:Uncharacterized protein n=1 Tax=Nymphaea colorata TaxID=210225 RepID=A0A5K0XEY4_9MAGN
MTRESFSPCAMRLEKRKALKDNTSHSTSWRAASALASQPALLLRLFWPGLARESPRNTAMVKREFTLTSPSRAVTWMFVVSPTLLSWSPLPMVALEDRCPDRSAAG